MKIIPVVGKSKTGKTTFLEKLIPELKKRGYRIAVIKHDIHGFEIDHKGKDTYRLKTAGADAVCISSPQKLALIKDAKEDALPDYLVAEFFSDFDLVLTEGYKSFPIPKIEVFRSDVDSEPLCKPSELILLATDKKIDFKAVQFGLSEIKKIADYLEKNVLSKQAKKTYAKLTVNNEKVPMKSFVQDLMARTLAGIVESLKGTKNPKRIVLEVNLERENKKTV